MQSYHRCRSAPVPGAESSIHPPAMKEPSASRILAFLWPGRPHSVPATGLTKWQWGNAPGFAAAGRCAPAGAMERRDAVSAPFQGAWRQGAVSGGIAALNPRLISNSPAGLTGLGVCVRWFLQRCRAYGAGMWDDFVAASLESAAVCGEDVGSSTQRRVGRGGCAERISSISALLRALSVSALNPPPGLKAIPPGTVSAVGAA
jgi:hypothetical protein